MYHLKAIFENYLKESFQNIPIYSPPFKKVMKYSLFDAGKRLRPLFCMTVWQSLQQKNSSKAKDSNLDAILPFAAAIELIHCYSLIHDDLPAMDNDDYRRGKLANHKKFGEANAILAGCALLTGAFTMITKHSKNSEKTTLRALSSLTEGAVGMLSGQYMDLNLAKNFTKKKKSPSYFQKMVELKTACLFQSSFQIPAILSEVNLTELNILKEIGKKIGVCFQIQDDFLDFSTSSKPTNIETNYISFFGKEKTTLFFEKNKKELIEMLAKLNYPVEKLKALIDFAFSNTVPNKTRKNDNQKIMARKFLS